VRGATPGRYAPRVSGTDRVQPAQGNADPSPATGWGGTVAASWVASAVLLCALSLCTMWDVDYWWQLATGDWIREHGMMRTEQFTQDHAGTPRIESSWLYCVALSVMSGTIGVPGLVVLKTALWLVAFGALSMARRPAMTSALAGVLAPAVTGIAVLAASQRFCVRPETVSFALLGLLLFALERHRTGPRRWLLVPPLLQAIWVNVHSYWVVGVLCVAAYAACEHRRDGRWRAWIACLSGCAGACLCNPYGLDMLTLPLNQFGLLTSGAAGWGGGVALAAGLAGAWIAVRRPGSPRWRRWRRRWGLVLVILTLAVLWASPAGDALIRTLLPAPSSASSERANITELASPFDIEADYPALLWFKVLASLAFACIVAVPSRADRPAAIVATAGFALAVLSVRNLPLFCLPAAMLASAASARLLPVRWLSRRRLPAAGIVAAMAGTVMLHWSLQAVTNRFWIRQGAPIRSGLGIEPFHFADGACGFLRRIGFDGRLFNSHSQGGLLIAEGFWVHIDPRAVNGSLAEHVAIVGDTASASSRLSERFDACLLDVGDAPMASRLVPGGWRVAFADPAAIVLLRPGYRTDVASIEPADPVAISDIRERIGEIRPHAVARPWTAISSPWPSLRMAMVLHALGRPEAADAFMVDAIRAYPPAFAARDR
jgi:hypothetical protein